MEKNAMKIGWGLEDSGDVHHYYITKANVIKMDQDFTGVDKMGWAESMIDKELQEHE